MPLVVPGINSPDASAKSDDWTTKLMGKTLGDKTNETTFAKTDLPEQTRVIPPGSCVTKDYNPTRLNVHLDDDGTVRDVNHG